ncbi:MAG TPA: protein kinase [Polyangiaceae bacterium]|nr:MAG: Serine/threonine-protein kinase PrkC [Deltaproteobacteria bacterium ADurb.Bin207]HNS99580.1 protein kinase [Polyangiaceae bacterium]HNZ23962.1 protein kinase [Polyangiaceae bacterium]HOD21787.1 protein kinase [Polyangiaceae bacterium]HOE49497.1 protein kinase [Polyangiaceae bacterium]
MTPKPAFRSTITQALADTVIDESRSDPGSSPRPTLDVSKLPEVGDMVGSMYRLIRVLGQGTFGKVYVAERVDVPEHQVALKITLREAYSGRDVERELVMLAAAGHPHMVQLKDHGTTAEYVWFTMPVYEGETLAKRLQRGTLSLKEAHEIFVPIARSLDALHRSGLRHQDLKPDNVFLAQFGGRIHPIILDLGVAAERTSKFVAGTILFASPEQTLALTHSEEDVPLSEKMDTYGLAATLLLSLVGTEYFPGSNAGTYQEMESAQHLRATHPLASEALPHLKGNARKLLEKALCAWFTLDPSQRPSMAEMADGLDVLLEQEREEKKAEALARTRQKAKLLRTRLAVVALMVLALGFLGAAYSKRETLQLANELEQARAEEKQSFDNLNTCNAAQKIVQRRLARCEETLQEEASLRREQEKLRKSSDESKDECTKQLMTFDTKVKTCEDDADAAAKACSSEREKLVAEQQKQVKELTEERDNQRQLAEECQGQVDKLRQGNTRCEADLAVCQLGRKNRDNPYTDPLPSASTPSSTPPPLPPPPAEDPIIWE